MASTRRGNKPQVFALKFLEYLKKTPKTKAQIIFFKLGISVSRGSLLQVLEQWRRASSASELPPVTAFLSLQSCSGSPRALGRDHSSLVCHRMALKSQKSARTPSRKVLSFANCKIQALPAHSDSGLV